MGKDLHDIMIEAAHKHIEELEVQELMGEFLSHSLSLKAKKKWYKGKCFAYYTKEGILHGNLWAGNPIEMGLPDNSFHVDCYAPLVSQIIKWFKTKHHIRIIENPSIGEDCWLCVLDIEASEKLKNKYDHTGFLTLNEALEEAFKLIENEKLVSL